jgi:hypothetical protein
LGETAQLPIFNVILLRTGGRPMLFERMSATKRTPRCLVPCTSVGPSRNDPAFRLAFSSQRHLVGRTYHSLSDRIVERDPRALAASGVNAEPPLGIFELQKYRNRLFSEPTRCDSTVGQNILFLKPPPPRPPTLLPSSQADARPGRVRCRRQAMPVLQCFQY